VASYVCAWALTEENEHRLLADRAKAIAEQEKRAREIRENGESEIPPPAPAAQPPSRKAPSVIAPAVGRPTEATGGDTEAAGADAAPPTPKTTIGPNGEIIMDRSEYEAHHRYVPCVPLQVCLHVCAYNVVAVVVACRFSGDEEVAYDAGYDDDDDYGYAGGNDDHDEY
jgi:hypothetical protein